MKKVKLNVGLLVKDVNHPAGAVVAVSDDRADDMVKCGAAALHMGSDVAAQAVANPDYDETEELVSQHPPKSPTDSDATPDFVGDPLDRNLAFDAMTERKPRKPRVAASPRPQTPTDVDATVDLGPAQNPPTVEPPTVETKTN